VLTFRRVLVLGAVRDAGSHHLPTGHSTLSEALGAAGGVTPDGRHDRFVLIRGGEATEHRLGGRGGGADVALRSGDEVYVTERPWLARNQTVLATVISSAVTLVVTALLVTRGG
jgi:protein involved in polysaccharide export with SLBB domain